MPSEAENELREFLGELPQVSTEMREVACCPKCSTEIILSYTEHGYDNRGEYWCNWCGAKFEVV